MATVYPASRHTPLGERTVTITDIVAGDTIDIKAALGRSATRVKIIPADSTDEISLYINNTIRIKNYYQGNFSERAGGLESPLPVYITSTGAHFPLQTMTGSEQYYTEDSLKVSSIHIDAITFGAGGMSITIVAW